MPATLFLGSTFLAAIGAASGERWWAIILGGLLAVVAIALLIASWTKWGQTKSLTKCIALAFLAHIWLLVYAYGTRIITPGSGDGYGGGASTPGVVSVLMNSGAEFSHLPPSSLLDPTAATSTEEDSQAAKSDENESLADDTMPNEAELRNTKNELSEWEKPIETLTSTPLIPLADLSHEELFSPPADAPPPIVPEPLTAPNSFPAIQPDMGSLQELLSDAGVQPTLPPPPIAEQLTAPSLAQQPPPNASLTPSLPPPDLTGRSQSDWIQQMPFHAAQAGQPAVQTRSSTPQHFASTQHPNPSHSTYQNRFANNRMEIVRAGGGDENTEAAVERALDWLARAQSPNGGWYVAAYGAGNPAMINRPGPDGEYRQNAGVKANTAMTGLALLAFLGAGHHHLDGQYSGNVRNALQYLINEQLPSGDMSGREQVGRDDSVRFARMYSHGMASLAVAEAYAITRDQQLLPVVQAACQYSLRAMNPRTGGWRYEYPTDDPGDTSQFGWQALLLHSASNAGASPLGTDHRSKMERFLHSVTTGRAGGLATYKPARGNNSPDQATPSMTAEALASRLLLGVGTSSAAASEAQQYMLRSTPGRDQDNFYYWYYATMALYQLKTITQDTVDGESHAQGWRQWNDALKSRLCGSQVTTGPNSGSWNPTCVWGNYGGRVYTTALGALSLEVYYRYLPVLQTQMANAPLQRSDAFR